MACRNSSSSVAGRPDGGVAETGDSDRSICYVYIAFQTQQGHHNNVIDAKKGESSVVSGSHSQIIRFAYASLIPMDRKT